MKAPALLTPADWHGYLVDLVMQAYDRTEARTGPMWLRAQRRVEFEDAARERLAQAAQAVVLEIDLARSGR